MKKRVFSIIGAVAVAALLFNGCTKSEIDQARESYDWNSVIPKVLDFQGPSEVAASGLTPLPYSVSYRGGSSYTFTTAGYGATIEVPDPDYPNEVMVTWNQSSVDTFAYLICVETTAGGVSSEPDSLGVILTMFCPLQNGANDLAGSWSGDDAYYPSQVVTTAPSSTELAAYGMGYGFIFNWWGEQVVDSAAITISVDQEGFVTIPRQYVFTTVWKGDNYDYEIEGSGTWDNCGTSPHMLIQYDIYYAGDADGLAKTYSAYLNDTPYLTADITLGSKKSVKVPVKIQKPPFKR